MILLPFIALACGYMLFYYLVPDGGLQATETFARYTAIAVLAGLDTILGGVRAWLKDEFDDMVFITGFFINAVLAAGLVVLGEKLGLETGVGDDRISIMMIAAVVVFGTRILNNLAAIRRMIIERWRDRQMSAAQPTAGQTPPSTAPVGTISQQV
ncbi:MAG: small basic family protein [Abitibacteriaceae bacterium]|nr:small basic family protein [Abditibacteriaceae bacterium]